MTDFRQPVFQVKGARGRSIDVYPNKCVITVNVSVGSIFSSNSTDGQKTIFYSDVVGIQFKKPGVTLGYIQLETSSSSQNNSQSNFFNENTFTFDNSHLSDTEAERLCGYITNQVELIKTMTCFGITPSQEVQKYKKLSEAGMISENEYSEMRKNILGLMGAMAEYEDSVLQEKRERLEQDRNRALQVPAQRFIPPQPVQQMPLSANNSFGGYFDIYGFMDTIQRFDSAKDIAEYVQALNSQNPGFFNDKIIEQLYKCAYVEKMYGNNKIEAIKILAQFLGISY